MTEDIEYPMIATGLAQCEDTHDDYVNSSKRPFGHAGHVVLAAGAGLTDPG